jgi:uncharacterized protein with von Willebrand factor type A (vWA) domain
LIFFHRFSEAQKKLLLSLKAREPSQWEERTLPPSPLSEAEEEDNSNQERNPFLPDLSELNPSKFPRNNQSEMQISISDSILRDNEGYHENDNEESNLLELQ